MEKSNTYFEQVPVETAKKAARQEALAAQRSKPKRRWEDIARDVSLEGDPVKMLELVEELNAALEEYYGSVKEREGTQSTPEGLNR